jgi:hypothetical protein
VELLLRRLSSVLLASFLTALLAAFLPAFFGSAAILFLAATRPTLFPTARFLVYSGPSSRLCLFAGDAAILIAFLDVLGFSFLLIGISTLSPRGIDTLRL